MVQRVPILDQLLRFVHPEDANADYLVSGNCYEWYAGYAAELQPSSILEIGSRRGYSLLAMLLACDSVRHVACFDDESYGVTLDDLRANLAKLRESRAFVATITKGNTQRLDRLPVDRDYDLIHVDGDHTFAGALHDLKLAEAVLADDGTIILDDVTFYRDVNRALTEFLKSAEPGQWNVERIPSFRGHTLLRRVSGTALAAGDCAGDSAGDFVPVAPAASAVPLTQLDSVRGGMFRPTSIEQSQSQVVGACNGHTSEERWADEAEPFARAINEALPRGESVLVVDYGCGCGRIAKQLLAKRAHCFLIGVDSSREQRELAKDFVGHQSFRAEEPELLDQAADTVDLVYCVYVLQHVPAIELRDVLRRIHRVLKPDGRFVYCGSDYRLAISEKGFFDDRFLGVNVREEIARLFVEERDLFDLANEPPLIRDLVTAEGCPRGSIAHPAKVYRRRDS